MSNLVERSTSFGRLRGIERLGVETYLGVRYAQPARRFQPSEPPTPWQGVYDATTCQAIPPQGDLLEDILGPLPRSAMSEDCLFLNVHVPGPRSDAPRPVIVWVHGGGHVAGAANFYDGTALALGADVVVVCINYRLGVFGSVDARRFGTAQEGTGELWLDDQIAALRWVRDHIADFGGNPELVTIVGQSGGGVSVSALCGAPAAEGLVHRAVACSPGRLILDPASNAADAVAKLKKCTRAQALEILKSSPVDELLAMQKRTGRKMAPQANAGTPSLPQDVSTLIRRRGTKAVPLITGFATHEGDSLDYGVKAVLHRFPWPLPNLVQHLGALRIVNNAAGGAASGPAYVKRLKKATGTRGFGARFNDLIWTDAMRHAAIEYAESTTAAGSRGYVYVFDVPTRFKGHPMRSTHGVDLDFTFNIWEDPQHTIRAMSDHPQARALARRWVRMLGHFARSGEPGDALGKWPVYEPGRRASMRVTAEQCQLEFDVDAVFRQQVWV